MNLLFNKKIMIACFALFCAKGTIAQIRLPKLIADGMVLQRDQPVTIWGWASPGEQVQVTFKGKSYYTVTNTDKKWQIILPKIEAGGPFAMMIAGTNRITIKDILIGDVWLCGGQSNMEFELGRAKEKYPSEIANSANNQIRQFLVKRAWNFVGQEDLEASDGWKAADPTTVLHFTAVGYFFARELYNKYHVPIGLINCNVGGTPVEAWTSAEGLKQFPSFLEQIAPYEDAVIVKAAVEQNKVLAEQWYRQVKQLDKGLLKGQAKWAEPGLDISAWRTINVPGAWIKQGIRHAAGITWLRRDIVIPETLAGKDATLFLGHIADQDSTYFNGVKVGSIGSRTLPRKYNIPGKLVKAGLNTISVRVLNQTDNGELYMGKTYKLALNNLDIPLTGEWKFNIGVTVEPYPSDRIVNFPRQPTALFNSMISPLLPYQIKGVIWYQGEANTAHAYQYRELLKANITDWRKQWKISDMPFLIVQLANFGQAVPEPAESSWAELREAQSMALSLPNTGMAVIHDIGEWNDIHPLNKLDVGRRLALVAQKTAYGDKKVVASGPVYQSMIIKGKEVYLKFTEVGSGLIARNGGELKQFSIAGSDHKFVWANARIDGDQVIVSASGIDSPVAVRYAWANNPDGANLYNKEGLPASPFRTDDWQAITQK